MVTFRAMVKYIDRTTRTTTRGGPVQKYHVIKCMDTDTRRYFWFYDWSGSSDNWKEMEKHPDEILYIEGYVNSRPPMNFLVMQRWAVWDPVSRAPVNPFTGNRGFVEAVEKFKLPKDE